MNSDKKYDIDGLIEEAFIEKGARKQMQALEKEIRQKEQLKLKRLLRWIGGSAAAAAAAAAVVLAVVRPWRETPDVVPGNGAGSETLAEASGGESGVAAGQGNDAGNGQDTGNGSGVQTGEQNLKDAAVEPVSVEVKAKAACRDYIAALEPFRSGAPESVDAKVVDAIGLLKKGENDNALKLLNGCTKEIEARLSELSGRKDDNAVDEKAELGQMKEDVQWLTALSYLGIGEAGQAKPILKELSESDGQYSAYASDLLAKVFSKK